MEKVVIIGGGPSGYSAAIRAAQLGFEVVLVEKNKLGGTCLNSGCIPAKSLLESSHLYAAIKSEEFGIIAENVSCDLNKIYDRTSGIINKLERGISSLIKSNGITYYNQAAKLIGNKEIELSGGEKIKCDKIILATGAKPVVLPVKGIENALTSEDILAYKYRDYQSITIIGGGVVGIEFATFFSELGSKVTVIDCLDNILGTMTEDIAKYIKITLKRKGVKFILGARVNEIIKKEKDFDVLYTYKEKENILASDIVINCAGRKANSIEGIENTQAVFDNGFFVDEKGKTLDDDIYAIGDCVKGNIQLAHYAAANGIRVIEALANKEVLPIINTPSVVYTKPDAALVGRREKECRFETEVGKFNMGANGKSVTEGAKTGYIKVIFDKDSQRLVGAEIVCNSAGELVGFVGNLINIGATRSDILQTVFPHPSISEGFYEAVEDSIKMSIHTIYRK